jgi:riboflavin synthase alpha subunit
VFSGIVEARGKLVRLERHGERVELEVDVGAVVADGVAVGDSVALDGLCLTVTDCAGSNLRFQAIPETLSRTALSHRRVGDELNVERALRLGDRLSGPIVQGHVDGTGVVRAWLREGDDVRLRIDCASELSWQLVPKGSVTVDGISLTVVDPDARGFSVALIPHTLESTTLGTRRPGDLVNLEADVLGKYVLRYLEQLGHRPALDGPPE